MSTRATVIVLGMMGRTPYAGVAWQVLQYLEGLRRLGYDVFYVEDTGDWPYDADRDTVTDDCTYTVTYIARLLRRCNMENRWAYRSGVDGRVYGLSDVQLDGLLKRADALINLTGATILRDEHRAVPIRIYLETDPVLPQIEVEEGRQFTIDLLSAHTHHFTYGENLGASDCLVPTTTFRYRPTRQPIVLDWWAPPAGQFEDVAGRFTTIANWQQSGKDIEWNGETYSWSKHLEFLKFIELPQRTEQPLELALACGDLNAVADLRTHGWSVIDALPLSKDVQPYHDYIVGSRGEFTVAKDQNIRLRSGWFSDRSASYLATGKPVVTQDTAFGKVLPAGEGLFAFETMEDILLALDTINGDYRRHAAAALEIADQYFRAETVIETLMSEVGL